MQLPARTFSSRAGKHAFRGVLFAELLPSERARLVQRGAMLRPFFIAALVTSSAVLAQAGNAEITIPGDVQGNVMVDGKFAAALSKTHKVQVSAGRHTVRVEDWESGRYREAEVEVAAGQSVEVKLGALSPAPKPR